MLDNALVDKVNLILHSGNAVAIAALSSEITLVYEYVSEEARETDPGSESPRR